MSVSVVVRDVDLGIEYGSTATVVQWLKEPGDQVSEGEPLLEVETTKASVVIVAPVSGVLKEILVQAGETWDIANGVCTIE
jgi:pyruvate/2-oxoglutarate dehydrogenase complex dihydrolipoamide acyltransferase (E2) component